MTTEVEQLREQVAQLKQENEEYVQLFNLQQTRMRAATRLWHDRVPNTENKLPDLGNLLDFLLSELKEAESLQAATRPAKPVAWLRMAATETTQATLGSEEDFIHKFRQSCEICNGAGRIERKGYSSAGHMDSGGEPVLVSERCYHCKGVGWLYPPAHDLLEDMALLARENQAMRGLLAKGEGDCPFCGLPSEKLLFCTHGFPGCPRMDEIVVARQSAVEAQLNKRLEDTCNHSRLLEEQVEALKKQILGIQRETTIERRAASRMVTALGKLRRHVKVTQLVDQILTEYRDDLDPAKRMMLQGS